MILRQGNEDSLGYVPDVKTLQMITLLEIEYFPEMSRVIVLSVAVS